LGGGEMEGGSQRKSEQNAENISHASLLVGNP